MNDEGGGDRDLGHRGHCHTLIHTSILKLKLWNPQVTCPITLRGGGQSIGKILSECRKLT